MLKSTILKHISILYKYSIFHISQIHTHSSPSFLRILPAVQHTFYFYRQQKHLSSAIYLSRSPSHSSNRYQLSSVAYVLIDSMLINTYRLRNTHIFIYYLNFWEGASVKMAFPFLPFSEKSWVYSMTIMLLTIHTRSYWSTVLVWIVSMALILSIIQ